MPAPSVAPLRGGVQEHIPGPAHVQQPAPAPPQWQQPPQAAQLPALTFAPEAHLPRERRLTVDSTGVTVGSLGGVLYSYAWSQCSVIRRWPTQLELVLSTQESFVVRASDWHPGADAVQAVVDRAPAWLLMPMSTPVDPAAGGYSLSGLARRSVVSLVVLGLLAGAFATSLWSITGTVGVRAAIIALVPSTLTLFVLRGLFQRLRVPRRWRDQAAQRRRSSVVIDSKIARASDHALRVGQLVAFFAALGIPLLTVEALGYLNIWPTVGCIALALAIGRERRRRRLA